MRISKEDKDKYLKKLKRSAGPLLWEYDVKKLSEMELKELLLERVMQHGNMKQIQMLMKIFTFNDLAVFFAGKGWKNFSNIDFNFWYHILKDFKKKEIDWNQLLHQRQSIRNKFIAWKH
ncbi:MAG: hypothetical protein EHM58_11460 [Ignavibacteriae bacterium]|nr:MAG: hypothetical protein EHM58_11460 [Ignavibacteriota bacterium]